MRSLLLAAAALLTLIGCSAEPGDGSRESTGDAPFAAAEQRFPDVTGVEVSSGVDGYTFDVTISSPYDSPERYADAFRVRSVDGATVYGVRELAHDHAAEQPFTRSLTGVQIPRGVAEVVVEGRDQAHGWGGNTRSVTVPAG